MHGPDYAMDVRRLVGRVDSELSTLPITAYRRMLASAAAAKMSANCIVFTGLTR